ncbi:heavy metal translocating P-type ATPase [Shewanella algae]|uniref:heavy metal translocating P-type ATPase n=1 Tax=Shewanella algae TaxID=38313 RepID=UPI003D7E7F5B
MDQIQFTITNMKCGGCASKIRALFADDIGVEAATEVADKSLTLTFAPGAELTPATAMARLKDAGYDAEQAEIEAPGAGDSAQEPSPEPSPEAPASFNFHVADMNCGHCESKLRRALADELEVEVDLKGKQLRLKSHKSAAELAELITGAGFTPPTLAPGNTSEPENVHFYVGDMTCGHCEASIRKALSDEAEVTVNLKQKRLALKSHKTAAELTELLKAAGFTAEPWRDEHAEADTETETEAQADTLKPAVAATTTETETKAGNHADKAVKQKAATLHPAKPTLLFVPDMSCASCVAKIEKAFAAKEVEARVNLADKQVSVAAGLPVAEAVALLLSAGYRAEPITDAASAMADKAEHDAREYRTRIRQAIAGLGLGIPLMIWGLAGGDMMIHDSQSQLIWGAMGLLTLLLLITTGGHFFSGMWRSLKAKSANMDTLIALGTGTAWLYSMLVVLIPGFFPDGTRHVYFEASVMILGLINLGHALELRARGKTSEAVQKLIGLQSNTAIKITENGDETVAIAALVVGDKLRLRPGDRVALDGEVLSGNSLLDESMLTGEPIPVAKSVGDSLSAGTVNGNGSLIYQVTAGPADTRLAKIIALVQEAQTSKMPIGRLTDKIAAVFVPVVVVIALLAAIIWYFAGPEPALSHALVVLTSVLIIACPCALGLATPMSIMVSVGRAASMGVLVKNGEALQTASKVSCVVLDKTGTITEGKPAVTQVVIFDDAFDERELLRAVASLEQHSGHPLAAALLDAAKVKEVVLSEPQGFDYRQGQGLLGQFEGRQWAVGNSKLMDALGIKLTETHQARLEQGAALGHTQVLVARDNQLLALVGISDPIKSDAKEAMAALKTQGKRLVLLSGDNQVTAEAVARQVGIEEVIAGVLPDEKQSWVNKFQAQGEVVAMVGDGINDAPALMAADVGIAMGSGTEIAIESADLTLLNPRLGSLAGAFALSRATLGNIKQNLFGAFIYNTLGIPIAAGVLYPLTGILLSPVVAGAAMALSSLTVVTNANRLRRQSLD